MVNCMWDKSTVSDEVGYIIYLPASETEILLSFKYPVSISTLRTNEGFKTETHDNPRVTSHYFKVIVVKSRQRYQKRWHYFLCLRPKQHVVLYMSPGGIRTRNPSKREAIDPRLKPHGAEIGVKLKSRS